MIDFEYESYLKYIDHEEAIFTIEGNGKQCVIFVYYKDQYERDVREVLFRCRNCFELYNPLRVKRCGCKQDRRLDLTLNTVLKSNLGMTS